MKKLNKIIAAAVITGITLTGATMVAQAKSKHTDEALAVISSPVTMLQAISFAQQAVAGTPAEAEFSAEDGKTVWEVEIVDKNKQTFEIEIDATSGKVLKQKLEKTDHDDDDEKSEKEDKKEDKA